MPDTYIEQLGQQVGTTAATGALGGIMGMIFGGANDRRQLRQQQALQDQQIAGNKQMVDYNYQKQLQMWKDTNYGAQMSQLEAAGLNPALMYGMGGGGGTTTGQATGQVTGAEAPKGGQEYQVGMGIAMQAATTQAQIKMMNAQADLAEAQAKKTSGVDTTKTGIEIQSLTQGIQNQKAQERLTNIQEKIATQDFNFLEQTIDDRIQQIHTQVIQGYQILDQLKVGTEIQQDTKEAAKSKLRSDAIAAYLTTILIKANTDATNQSIYQSKQTVANMQAEIIKWSTELSQKWQSLSQEQQKIELQKMQTDFTTSHPSIGQQLGKYMQNIEDGLKRLDMPLTTAIKQ